MPATDCSDARAYVDVTTLLGAINGLGLLRPTDDGPTSLHVIASLSQFVEILVLHDRLVYESSRNRLHQPYEKAILDSRLADHLGGRILSPFASAICGAEAKQAALEWAVAVSDRISQSEFEFAVAPRDSIYGCIERANGIADRANPYTSELFESAIDCGSELFRKRLTQAEGKLGRLSLHVLARVHMLHKWLTSESGISYVPHYSRVPLIKNALSAGTQSARFTRWALDEVEKHRRRVVDRVTDESERGPWDLELSPIFLACLPGARYPLEILDNALRLRSSTSASQLRRLCARLQANAQAGIDPTVATRADLVAALAALDDEARRQSGGVQFKLEVPPRISISRTWTRDRSRPGVSLFVDVFSLSLSIVHTRNALAAVFGDLDDREFWILAE